MAKYKAILFDFDRTLWDVDVNQKEALRAIHVKYGIGRNYPDFDEFYGIYLEINDRMWLEYRDDKISKDHLRNHRFVELVERTGVGSEEMALSISDEYIRTAPYFSRLIPGSQEAVEYLAGRYEMHIITNGFNEVQHLKLKNSGLSGYFGHVITSEDAGVNKPHKGIFDYALKKASRRAEEVLVIGDDPENDIIGGLQAGMDTVFFNPNKRDIPNLNSTYEINSLPELLKIL